MHTLMWEGYQFNSAQWLAGCVGWIIWLYLCPLIRFRPADITLAVGAGRLKQPVRSDR